ncbi:unnamed protein product [Sphenostylis stenocarpa]|uniref:Uncharacterized protein n=1 Tax=Sphenostylis stenocarpa TaxID=92480 RepID=A0AA86SGQ8_9FABA|nr:unnamed protein product [Sphenostylis stenocarpa]
MHAYCLMKCQCGFCLFGYAWLETYILKWILQFLENGLGGDGTLLQTSHSLDDKIPVPGVNSDPRLMSEFDVTRSTAHFCAATIENFEQVFDGILEGQVLPSKLTRMMISVNALPLSTYALNDILVAHPCPASLSGFLQVKSFLGEIKTLQLIHFVNFK